MWTNPRFPPIFRPKSVKEVISAAKKGVRCYCGYLRAGTYQEIHNFMFSTFLYNFEKNKQTNEYATLTYFNNLLRAKDGSC